MSEPASGSDRPERLLTLSDGVFAIAMTLLVLGISVRSGLSPSDFRHALGDTAPQLLAYALSFVVIAGFWLDHHWILKPVQNADGALTQLVLLSLGLIALVPFPTTLLAEYASQPQSVAIYAGAVIAIDAVHLALVLYLWRHPTLMSQPWTRSEARLAQNNDVNTAAAISVELLLVGLVVAALFVARSGFFDAD
jgi:uncharacterized membrane protein